MKTEIEELRCENLFLKRENERLIDIEKRTRDSNDRLWSLIEQQKKSDDLKRRSLSLDQEKLATQWVCLKRIISSADEN